MGLRIQLERHRAAALSLKSFDDYHQMYGLSRARLQRLCAGGILLHPGPINYGVEFALDATSDPRSRVLAQVRNGVLVRAALMALMAGPPIEPSDVAVCL
jgi:aspartate carbamoyltransferase catalytic subunit